MAVSNCRHYLLCYRFDTRSGPRSRLGPSACSFGNIASVSSSLRIARGSCQDARHPPRTRCHGGLAAVGFLAPDLSPLVGTPLLVPESPPEDQVILVNMPIEYS